MADSDGYMEYDFASLKKIRVVEQKEARDIFLKYFYLKNEYSFKGMVEFTDLEKILVDNCYWVMNNEPRRKGKQIFFTGNVVGVNKEDLLSFIREPIQKRNIIIPLMIVPVTHDSHPSYMLATQEDPIFEWFAIDESKDEAERNEWTHMSVWISFFGPAMEQKEAMSIRKDIIHMFRKPYLKHDMTTHGPLWNQYSFPQDAITVRDLEWEQDSSGYVYMEGKGKDFYIFLSNLSTFIQYLQSREDGLFPAIYFVDREYTICLCENGERGSMKPVYLYRGGDR